MQQLEPFGRTLVATSSKLSAAASHRLLRLRVLVATACVVTIGGQISDFTCATPGEGISGAGADSAIARDTASAARFAASAAASLNDFALLVDVEGRLSSAFSLAW